MRNVINEHEGLTGTDHTASISVGTLTCHCESLSMFEASEQASYTWANKTANNNATLLNCSCPWIIGMLSSCKHDSYEQHSLGSTPRAWWLDLRTIFSSFQHVLSHVAYWIILLVADLSSLMSPAWVSRFAGNYHAFTHQFHAYSTCAGASAKPHPITRTQKRSIISKKARTEHNERCCSTERVP